MTMAKLTLAQLHKLHQEYVAEYDPSPQSYGDSYGEPLDFYSWFESDSEGFGWIIERDGLNPADYRFLPVD